MQRTLVLATAAALVAFSARDSRADLWLYMSSGPDTYTIQDNTALDLDSTVGSIVPNVPSVGEFLIDPTMGGVTLGGGLEDALVDVHMNITYIANPGPPHDPVFVLQASATNLSQVESPDVMLTGLIGGTSIPAIGAGNISFTVAYDPANGLFSFPPGSTVGPVSVGGLTFSAEQSLSVAPGNPFSLSYAVTVTADQNLQNIVFDSGPVARRNPEPTSLLLWAVASGVGVGVVRYRRARKKAGTEPATG